MTSPHTIREGDDMTEVLTAAAAAATASAGWASRAACSDSDPELFFPIGPSGPALRQIAQAKAVCAQCPVRRACLGYALATGQDAGVWGGTTEEERREIWSAGAGSGPRRDSRGRDSRAAVDWR